MSITTTYKEDNGKMVATGYFIYGESQPLQWVAIENVIRVYAGSVYTPEYQKALEA